jgi:alanine dehydrogenase
MHASSIHVTEYRGSAMPVQVPFIDAPGIEAALPLDQCIRAMRDVLCALDRGAAVQPVRSVIRLPDGTGSLYTMPAFTSEPRALTVKLITIFHGNEARSLPTHQGLVIVFDTETGRPALLLDAARLTAIRTAAVSACATAALARADAAVLAILGTGVQARSHAAALLEARRFRRISVWGRSPDRAHALVAELSAVRGDIEVVAAESARAAVADADVVCATTSAHTPILEGAWLKAGTHVNAIGASTADAREVDGDAVRRARVFVDSIEAAAAEAGDLILAQQEGATAAAQWTELGAVLSGRAVGRSADDEITLFKSVGLAVEDAAAAAIIVRNTGEVAP